MYPLVKDTCASCHSNDGYHPRFKLDTLENSYAAFTTAAPDHTDSGPTYVVAGDPQHSILIDKIVNGTPTYGGGQMPLDSDYQTPKPLKVEDQQKFVDWVAQGAKNN